MRVCWSTWAPITMVALSFLCRVADKVRISLRHRARSSTMKTHASGTYDALEFSKIVRVFGLSAHPLRLKVTDIKGAYEKLYNDENATPVMSTAFNASTSEMVTASTSGLDVEIGAPSTSGADAGMVASSTPIAALVSGSSQVCSESVFTISDRAFKNRLKTYIALNMKNYDHELKDILDCIANEMEDILKVNLKEQLALKFNIFVECMFANVHNETIFHHFKSKNDVLYQYSDVTEFVNKQKEKILKEFEEFSMKGSGLFYVKLHKLELRVNKYTPLMGGSAYIELPHSFVNKPDLECKYDWCIDFPVGIKDIAKFEKRNDISINVFGLDENEYVFPLRICEKELPDHRDLLYISNENTSHYCCITNFNTLVKPQLTAAVRSQIAVCKRCFAYFRHNAFKSCAERLKDHESVCSQFSAVRSVFPNKEYLSFDHPEFSQKLITDMTMLLLFEQGIRGGICQCVTRHAVANDPKSENFDDSKSPSAIYYVDANNLYGFAMSQKLPYGGFEWLSDEEIHHFDLQAINDDSEIGYILEVDIEYPNHLFEKRRDLPFCAEFAKPPGGKHKKLMTTLHSKQHYVAHYKLFQQAVDNGLQIVKIHRVIKFKQSYWLKQYIDLNTELRKNAKNNFEKDFFKLMNNAVFRKTMENVRKRPHFRLVSNDEKLKKLISKPYFLDRVIYAENLVGIHLARTQILFDKTLYVGMCILELSKVHMYNFHYSIMKEQFGDKLKLCYMDTDSFIYLIETDDLYHDLQNVRDHLDTSVYSPNHILFATHNKGVLGKFKDEIPNSHIDEFVGLKAKVYALKCSDFEIKKLKGVKKSVIRNELTFEDYATCRGSGITTYTKINVIRSYFHNVFTMCVNKVTLNSFDDKRVVLQDGINTAPHGFYEPPCKRRRVQE
ncbi:hypothetical protein ANN_00937 [Periplaneta americana]|uniref:DNA-directed DNA polymerase n=1 Tax=Periplaneta americana TaxID=6978 RepID=A0ABQ8TUK8_PERAM|nr:hypothetical protein ANN_00937 [Periplaneta americana]